MKASNNIRQQDYYLSRQMYESQNKHSAIVIWLTGLSGSGKSTLANEFSRLLFERNIKVFVLDADNARLGVNKDLGFSLKDRKENLRRAAEIAKLFVDSGTVIITSFISPLEVDRKMAKNIIGANEFVQVFVDCPIEVCEKRDVKGLYAKARAGVIKDFTGIGSPFERPADADIIVDTSTQSVQVCTNSLYEFVKHRIFPLRGAHS